MNNRPSIRVAGDYGRCKSSISVSVSMFAIFAKATSNIEWQADPISHFDAVYRAADLNDRAKILMPEDSAGLHTGSAFIHMQI
jgi:hypothetical protein